MQTGVAGEITEQPFMRGLFKALCVFQVALETESRAALAPLSCRRGTGRSKDLTNRCFSENEKRGGVWGVVGRHSLKQETDVPAMASGSLLPFLVGLGC